MQTLTTTSQILNMMTKRSGEQHKNSKGRKLTYFLSEKQMATGKI
jgi:hypothetical protein